MINLKANFWKTKFSLTSCQGRKEKQVAEQVVSWEIEKDNAKSVSVRGRLCQGVCVIECSGEK